ncbi:hypothetical protein K438DRAFT_1986229 [Mycena galopus ATCC 62051]|nr:hypothetical protein K438DRAFT_1986229 [Mycena galopus ATCC 62051]
MSWIVTSHDLERALNKAPTMPIPGAPAEKPAESLPGMLWQPTNTRTVCSVSIHARVITRLKPAQTRSGTVFAAWTTALDILPLLSRAIAADREDQEDAEPDDEPLGAVSEEPNEGDFNGPPDPLHEVDDEWPPPDPMNEVDDLPTHLPTLPESLKRKRRPASIHDLLKTGSPNKGAHRRCVRDAHRITAEGHTVRPSVKTDVLSRSEAITVPNFDSSKLPTAHGAYGGKTEQRNEIYGKKKQRSVAELIGLASS